MRTGTHWIARSLSVGMLMGMTLTSGCSLVQPYNWWSETPPQAEGGNLDAAIDYANQIRNEYLGAADTQAGLSTLGGPALLPLGAAAAGLAITGTTGAPIAALTLAGATGYGAATWLRSPTREQAYLLGARAIRCVLDAVKPLLALSSIQRHELKVMIGSVPAQQTDNVPSLPLLLSRASSQLSTFNATVLSEEGSYAGVEGFDAAIRDYQIAGAVAENIIGDGKETLQSGIALDARFAVGATGVVSGVEAVQDSVNEIVRTTIPSLNTLPSLIDQIGASVKSTTTPAPVPNQPKTTATKSAASSKGTSPPSYQDNLDRIEESYKPLKDSLDQIVSASSAISAWVGSVNSSADQSSPNPGSQCPVDFSQVSTGLVLTPGSVSLTAQTTATIAVAVSGGRPPYHAIATGLTPPSSLTVPADPITSGSVFVFQVQAKAVPQPDKDVNYYWLITDSGTATPVMLQVTLKKSN